MLSQSIFANTLTWIAKICIFHWLTNLQVMDVKYWKKTKTWIRIPLTKVSYPSYEDHSACVWIVLAYCFLTGFSNWVLATRNLMCPFAAKVVLGHPVNLLLVTLLLSFATSFLCYLAVPPSSFPIYRWEGKAGECLNTKPRSSPIPPPQWAFPPIMPPHPRGWATDSWRGDLRTCKVPLLVGALTVVGVEI